MAVQDVGQAADRFGVGFAVAVHRGAEKIGHAAGADGDAAFAGALAVAVGVVKVVKQLMPLPADLVPDLGRQRGRRDLGRVQRQPVALVTLDPGGKALGRAQDDRGADLTAGGGNKALFILRDGCALDNAHAHPFDHIGQATHQFCRLNAGHARHDQRPQRAGDVQA